MTTVTVLPGPERRRRWTTAEKLRIVEESLRIDGRGPKDLRPVSAEVVALDHATMMKDTTTVRTTCPRDCYDACGIVVKLAADGSINVVE